MYWSNLILRNDPQSTFVFGKTSENIFSPPAELELLDECYMGVIPRRYFSFRPRSELIPKVKHIFHSSYFRYSNNKDAINVTTVHDFTYEYYSQGIRKWVHGWQKKKAVKKSAGIICVSENTKKDLLEFYPWVDGSCVKVIYNGVSELFAPVVGSREKLKEILGFDAVQPYLLFVGDRSPYKNFDLFVELGRQLTDYNLVVVGGKLFNDIEQEKISKIKGRVHHFRGVATDVLNLLYNSAFCLVYPSSYEGFGIPVLEAMRAGCPVVSTNLSSIPEVAGDAGLLVDQITVEAFAEKIEQLNNANFRKNIVQKGFKQASKFSWDKCFEETYAFYQELWERSDIK